MKTWMKTSIAAAVIAVHALGATAALARDGEPRGPARAAGWTQASPEKAQQHAELRLARLELALAIKPEQQAAWDQFKTSIAAQQAKAGERFAARKDRPEAPRTASERLAKMEEMGQLHLAELAETRKAVDTLYPRLSDAQKKVFDAEFMKGPGPRGDHRGPGKGPGRDAGPQQGR